MNASLKRLLTGTALVGMLGLVLGGPLTRPVPTGAAPRLWPDPCNLAFPNRQPLRVIAVSAGVGHVITLQGGGYTFDVAEWQGFNSLVRRALGVVLPPGDAAAPFRFTLPRGVHSYAGLVHIVRHGTQQHLCLHGIGYVDLGNGSAAARAPSVRIDLDGTIGKTWGRIDLRVGRVANYVYGPLRVR